MIAKLPSIPDEIRMTEYTFGMISSGLVEAIHIQLSNETIHFVVSEITR
jgi:hypothetical protein